MQGLLPGKTRHGFSLPVACKVTFNTMKASQQGRSFQISSSWISLSPVFYICSAMGLHSFFLCIFMCVSSRKGQRSMSGVTYSTAAIHCPQDPRAYQSLPISTALGYGAALGKHSPRPSASFTGMLIVYVLRAPDKISAVTIHVLFTFLLLR